MFLDFHFHLLRVPRFFVTGGLVAQQMLIFVMKSWNMPKNLPTPLLSSWNWPDRSGLVTNKEKRDRRNASDMTTWYDMTWYDVAWLNMTMRLSVTESGHVNVLTPPLSCSPLFSSCTALVAPRHRRGAAPVADFVPRSLLPLLPLPHVAVLSHLTI